MLLDSECCLPVSVTACRYIIKLCGAVAARASGMTRQEKLNHLLKRQCEFSEYTLVLSVLNFIWAQNQTPLIVTWSKNISNLFYSLCSVCFDTLSLERYWWKLPVAEDEHQFLYLDLTYHAGAKWSRGLVVSLTSGNSGQALENWFTKYHFCI